MSLKLNDKEVSALAKKLAEKKQKTIASANKAIVKKYLPEAKKIMAQLATLPSEIIDMLYEHRYSRSGYNAETVARKLAGSEVETDKVSPEPFESDVILAAHDCTTMAALCKKLEI